MELLMILAYHHKYGKCREVAPGRAKLLGKLPLALFLFFDFSTRARIKMSCHSGGIGILLGADAHISQVLVQRRKTLHFESLLLEIRRI